MNARPSLKVIRCESTPTEERIFYELGGVVGCFRPAEFIHRAELRICSISAFKSHLEGKGDSPELDLIWFVENYYDVKPSSEPKEEIESLNKWSQRLTEEIELLQQAINIVRSGMFETKKEWFEKLIGEYNDFTLGVDEPPRAALGLTPTPERGAQDRLRSRELKSRIIKLAERDGCKLHETVPSEKVQKWVRELARLGLRTNENSVRAILSRYGYATERKGGQ